MKHKLLNVFLMLTAVPLVLSATTQSSFAPLSHKASEDFRKASEDRQPTNAELLTHLKNVKVDTKKLLQATNEYVLGWFSGSLSLLTVWNNIFDAFDQSNQDTFTDIENYFELLCNQAISIENLINSLQTTSPIKTINIITAIGKNLDNLNNTNNLNNEQKQQYKLLISIARNELENLEKTTGETVSPIDRDLLMYNIFSQDKFGRMIPYICYKLRILPLLIDKIDAKIAELEAQL